MKAHFVAFAAALAIIASGTAQAKKVPAPPPNIAAAAKADVIIAQETLPGSATFADVTIKYNVSHTFSLTAQQEAALSGDTIFSLLGINVSPNEDPKFDNGDQSYSVTKSLPIGLVDAEVPVQFKGKWGKGQFTTSVKISYKGKDLLIPESLQQIHQAITGEKGLALAPESVDTRAENLAYIETTIDTPTLDPFTIEAVMASDSEMTMTQGFSAEGVEYNSQAQSVQTKFFATEVLSAKK